jgi:hypothetical protein
MAYNQDDDPNEGPVVVKRAVYDAGMKLEAEVQPAAGGPAFENAREKVHECQAAGDAAGAAWWEEIFRFLCGANAWQPERTPSSSKTAKPMITRTRK